MKKILYTIIVMVITSLLIFTGISHAATLNNIKVETSKTTVRPGEEVIVTVDFGQNLGAYTVNVAYDDSIFEYVGVEGGTGNDTSDKVIVVYHDTTGGTNPRTNMNITFRAKSDITTSNPTEFTVTAEGLAGPNPSDTFDDITTPIVKNITVEPEYINYTLKLEHTGDIIKGQEIPMTISYSSQMGHYYEHARLIAEATTPQGATVKLLAKDQANLEHDIIQSGWGDAQGYKIGGKDVSQILQVRGLFSEVGDYTITLKLIDRDHSDQVIAQETFNFNTKETSQEPTIQPEDTQTPQEVVKQETPTHLPKTGNNIYIPIIFVVVSLMCSYVYLAKKK